MYVNGLWFQMARSETTKIYKRYRKKLTYIYIKLILFPQSTIYNDSPPKFFIKIRFFAMDSIDTYILIEIFSYLNSEELCRNAKLVCKRWRNTVVSRSCDYLYDRCTADLPPKGCEDVSQIVILYNVV